MLTASLSIAAGATFTLLALQGFGGVLAVAQRELVERLGWITREEFVETLRERVMDLMHDELELDNERRETLAWNYNLPLV